MRIIQRIQTYSIDEILEQVPLTGPQLGPYIKLEDKIINLGSLRYRVFASKGVVCAGCSLEGQFFALETQDHRRWILHLYGLRDQEEIIFTKDHIIPKSRGGHTILENLQPMCFPCNNQKGNTLPPWVVKCRAEIKALGRQMAKTNKKLHKLRIFGKTLYDPNLYHGGLRYKAILEAKRENRSFFKKLQKRRRELKQQLQTRLTQPQPKRKR